MSPASMSHEMVGILKDAAGFIPPPGNAVVMTVAAIIAVAVHIHENRKASSHTEKMLKDLCDRSCIISDLVRGWSEKLSCEKDLWESTANGWQQTLEDLSNFMKEIDNRSYMSRIFHSNAKDVNRCKDFSDRLHNDTGLFVLFAVTTMLKNQSQCPSNYSWVTEGSGEGVICSANTTAADVNDDIVESWFGNTDDDKITNAAEVEAIVHKLSEQADAESIVEKRLLGLQSDAAVHDKTLVQSLLSSLRSFQGQASEVGETEPWPPMNTDPGAQADVGKRARIKRVWKEKKEKILSDHPHVQKFATKLGF